MCGVGCLGRAHGHSPHQVAPARGAGAALRPLLNVAILRGGGRARRRGGTSAGACRQPVGAGAVARNALTWANKSCGRFLMSTWALDLFF